MFGIGMPEMLLILAIALIVIGPKKLPDLAKSLGKAMGEFKKATRELKDSFEINEEIDDVKKSFGELEKEVTATIKDDDASEPVKKDDERKENAEGNGPSSDNDIEGREKYE